ncbi:MAG: hypothetical protein ABI700_17475 [Chloroflexota bacterium]
MYATPPPPEEEVPPPEPPRIRPIWLIGGGAAVAVLGVCALISVVAAGVLIWLSSGISSRSATSTPTQAVVAQNPTPVITSLAPTPLPGVSTAPPVTVTPAAAPALPPDQAVRSYFQLVSQQRYDLTWPLLSDSFKQKFNCCAPNYDYAGYTGWWDSVNYVDFGTVSTVSQNADRAVVYAELYFVMNTGARSGVDSNPYIELIFDPASGVWHFNDKRAAP